MRRIPRPSPAMVVALTGVALGLGGVAFATIPDSGGMIHGCYNKTNGNLRLVDSESQCRSNERAISWNQQPSGSTSVKPLGDVTLADDEQSVLFSEGALTVTAECIIDSTTTPFGAGPRDIAQIVVSTTQAQSLFKAPHAQAVNGFGGNQDFSPITPKDERTIYLSFNNTGQPSFQETTFTAAAPDGTRLSGQLNSGVNVLGRQGKCVFGGHVVVG